MNSETWNRVKDVLDAALRLPAEKRAPFLEETLGHEPELRGEVESLLRSHDEVDTGFLRDPAVTVLPGGISRAPRIGRRMGAYNILEEIGRGGMGEVYRAVRGDGEFDREVAIKLVQGGLDSQSVLERFRHERQILAGLDHPNVARLLDGGTTEDGLPYLVMELVDGVPIDRYCEIHKLKISDRVRLFLDVCAAVQYAHQRLVIHRDIKPGNILVNAQGVPKLLDFGIAKLTDPTTTAQTTLVRPMTPEYASPEQIKGEPITTATDVYSLGVVLYQLLTGQNPHQPETHSPHEMARVIAEEEPVRPSVLMQRADAASEKGSAFAESPARWSRELAGDLDNILLKALRKEPERRYSSAEQLAADLRRYLEGKPVLARKDSWNYRAGKFVRRHRVAVSAAALVVLLVIVGVVAVLREARIAQENARRAERRFNDTRKLANALLTDIHDAIRELPGATPARKMIVDNALQYLDGLAKEAGGDPSLQRELADAYEKVGLVQGGYPGQPNLGDTAGALASFRKMIAIRETLAKADPANVQTQLSLASGYRFISDNQAAYLGDVAGGFENCSRAVAITEKLFQQHPNDRAVKIELGFDYEKLADIHGGGNGSFANLANFQQGLELHEKALSLAESLARAEPDNKRIKAWLADLHYKLAADLVEVGNLPEAHRHAQSVLDLFSSLAEENNAIAQREVGAAYASLSSVLQAEGRFREALDYSRKQLATVQPVVAADPKNLEFRQDVASSQASVGYLLCRSGRCAEGLPQLRKALAEAVDVDRLSNNDETHVNLAVTQVWMAWVLDLNHDPAGALSSYTSALAGFKAIGDRDASDANIHLWAGAVQNQIADLHRRLNKTSQAYSEYQEVLGVLGPVASRNVAVLEAKYQLMNTYAGLGDIAVARSRSAAGVERQQALSQARAWYKRAVDVGNLIPNPTAMTPGGFDARSPKKIAASLAQLGQSFEPGLASAKR